MSLKNSFTKNSCIYFHLFLKALPEIVRTLIVEYLLMTPLLLIIYNVNTRIYNLISVPQITRLLLGDAITSSKTDPHNSSKKEKRSYGEVKNNNTMLKILPFIKILYLKQQSSVLRCFCRLKFEKSLINNTFFSFIFHSKMIRSYS